MDQLEILKRSERYAGQNRNIPQEWKAKAQQMQQEAATAHRAQNETDIWICSCGQKNTGKFCSECGRPRQTGAWICSCGQKNTGKFCSECGKSRP